MLKFSKNILHKGFKCILSLSLILSGYPLGVFDTKVNAQEYTRVYQGVQNRPIVLNDGTYLFDNVTVKGDYSQPSAVIIEGKVTIVIEGRNNVMGYDALWSNGTQYASGAGFQVEKQGSYSSELIIRGEKSASLYVKGGNANKGENGTNGDDGYSNRSPGGGRGGQGGNGGSSAIGGRGGVNGSPKGKDAGKISLLGAFTLHTDAGKGGAGGRGGNGGHSDGDWDFFTTSLSAGAGGGGGGGGGFPGVDIGGGGAAGGNGGNGGHGQGLRTTTFSAFSKEGGAGGGGGRGWGAGGGGGTGFFAYYIGQPKWSSIRPQGGKGGTDPDHRGEGGQVGIMEATLPGSGSDAGAYTLRVGSYSGDAISVDDAEGEANVGHIKTTRNAPTEPQQRRHGSRFGGLSASACNEYSMWGGYGSDCAWAFRLQGGGETPEAKDGHGLGRRYELWIQNGGATDGDMGEKSQAGSGPIQIDKSENIKWPDQGETGNGGGTDKDAGEETPVIRTVIDLSHPDTKITFTPPVGVYNGEQVKPQISIVSSTGIKVDPNAYDVYTEGDLIGPGTVKYRFVGKGEAYENQWVEKETTRDYIIEKGNMNAYLIESDNFYSRRLYETFNVEIYGYENDNNNVTWSVEPDPSTPDIEFTTTPNTKPGVTITSTKNTGKIIVKATISEGNHYKELTTQPITLNVLPQGAELFTISKIPDQKYTGSEIRPEFSVTFGDTTLTEGIDYTFTYENNVEVGRAKVVVNGTGGNYEGTFTSYFNIVPADISPIIFKNANYSTTPPTLANLYYTSYPQISQPLDGLLGDKNLVEGKDYLVSYSNMTEVGKVVATVVGIGNYTNSTTLEYEILPAEIDKIPGLMINRPENVVYDGTAKQQKPTVMLNGRILKEGTDYTLSYQNNVKAGTATAIITGKGSFTSNSQMTTNFQILQRPIYVVPEQDQWKYSGDNEPTYKYHLDNVIEGDIVTMKNEGTITRESGEGVDDYRFLLGELGLDYGTNDNDNYVLYMSPDVVNFKVKSYDTDEVAIIRGEIINDKTGERAVVNQDTGWYNNIVEVVAPEGYLISRSTDKDFEGSPEGSSFWKPYFSSEDGDFSKDGEGMTYYLMKIPEKEGDKSLISQAKQVNYKQDTIAPSSRIEMNQKKIYTEFKKALKFETYFQNDVKLDVISSDVTSGVLSNDYYLADKEYTKKELDKVTDWVSKTEAEYQLTLNTEMKKIMYLRTIDVAGNVTYVNTDGFIIDKTAPVIVVDYPKDGVWVTGNDAVVKVKVTEDLSGVDERYVDYHFEYSDGRVSDPSIIKLDKDGNATITNLPDGDYKLVVTAKDKAGNTYSDDDTHVKIDTIQPTLELNGNITAYEQSKDIDIIANVGPSLVDKVYVQRQDYGDPCDEAGTWVEITDDYKNNHKYNVDENGTYYVKYVNGAGVESNIATISFDTIDKTKPIIDIKAITVSDDQTYLSNDWTKDNVKVFFKNGASNRGNTKYSYRIKKSTDTEWSDWQSTIKKNDYEAAILLSQSGKFQIEMKIISESGMESDVSSFIVNIDKQLPKGQIKLVDKTWDEFLTNPSFDTFYNTDQNYIIKPSDELSGVLSVQYILLKDDETKISYTIETIEDLAKSKGWSTGNIDPITNDVKVPITSDATYVIYVKIVDKVGNVRYISSDGAIVDATKPNLEIDKDALVDYHYPTSPTKWITDPYAILPTTLTDSLAGQDKLILQYKDGGVVIKKEVDIRLGSYDIKELPEGIYDLVVDGYDKAGNKASETIAINKDTVTPEANLTGDTVNLGKNKHVEIDPIVGTSGLKKVEYQFVAEGGTFNENGPWTDITSNYGDGLDIKQNGTLYVKVENNLGITNQESLSFGNIQEVPVEIMVDTIDEDGILVGMNNGWYPSIYVRFYNEPRQVSDLKYEYHNGDGNWQTISSLSDGYALIKAPEGETTYTVRISNPETLVSKSKSITVKVDTTKPTGELTTTATNSRSWLDATNTTTINYGLQKSVDVVLKNVKDATNSSGLKSVEYYVMTAGKNNQLINFPKDLSEVKKELTGKWVACNATQMKSLQDNLPITLTNLKVDQEYIVFVRVKDVAGNTQYITSDGISIDAAKPIIETDYVADTWITDNTKPIKVNINDNLSGVLNGTYKISKDLISNTYDYQLQNRQHAFDIPIIQVAEGKSTLTIEATDVAGNVAETYSIGILKDTVKPVIHINQGNSTTHQVGIIIDAIGASDIKQVYVTCDNGAFEKMDITSHYGEGIQIPRNGTYTFVLVNNAGVSSEPVSITIDDMGEAPIALVHGINGLGDVYQEGTWSNSEVSMQVTVENLQIGKSVYEYSLDGKTWTVMTPDANAEYWITQRNSGEFTYHFRVTAADGARSDVITYKVKVDTTIPEFTYEITPNDYTNRWVDIIIHPNNEADTLSYSFDGGATYSKSKVKRFISNGYVDLVVKNETGTKAEKTAKIDNIDRLSPLMMVYENQVTEEHMYRVELEVNDAPENLDFTNTGVRTVFITNENPYSEHDVRTKPLESDFILEKEDNQHYVTKGEFKAELNGNVTDNYWIIATDNVGNYKIKSFRVSPDNGKVEENPDPEDPTKPEEPTNPEPEEPTKPDSGKPTKPDSGKPTKPDIEKPQNPTTDNTSTSDILEDVENIENAISKSDTDDDSELLIKRQEQLDIVIEQLLRNLPENKADQKRILEEMLELNLTNQQRQLILDQLAALKENEDIYIWIWIPIVILAIAAGITYEYKKKRLEKQYEDKELNHQ